MSLNSQNARVLYLRNVLGVHSVLLPENFQQTSEFQNTEDFVVPALHYQTYNEGPFLFLNYSETKNTLEIEALQLLEKIIVALKIPFHKTSIAITNSELSQISLEGLKQMTSGFQYVFLLGEVWSRVMSLSYGEQRHLGTQTFYATYDLKSLLENAENKKIAWAQFKQILPELQAVLSSFKGLK